MNCDDGVYTATFQPDEAGTWKISVTYEDEHIQDSPFTCFVFDPHAVTVGPHLYRVSTGFLIIFFLPGCAFGGAISVSSTNRSRFSTSNSVHCNRFPKTNHRYVAKGSRPKVDWGTCFELLSGVTTQSEMGNLFFLKKESIVDRGLPD